MIINFEEFGKQLDSNFAELNVELKNQASLLNDVDQRVYQMEAALRQLKECFLNLPF